MVRIIRPRWREIQVPSIRPQVFPEQNIVVLGEVVQNRLSGRKVCFDANKRRSKTVDAEPGEGRGFSQFDIHGQEIELVNPESVQQIVQTDRRYCHRSHRCHLRRLVSGAGCKTTSRFGQPERGLLTCRIRDEEREELRTGSEFRVVGRKGGRGRT